MFANLKQIVLITGSLRWKQTLPIQTVLCMYKLNK